MSLKILLADDSMTAQNMGKKILTEAGYEVVAVSNGAAAVKKIAEHKPDIAILDIYMPGYTGLEVCERVKGTLESSRTPVLLTVGKMEPYRVEDGARVRADGVIVKPFEASDLLAAIEKLAEKVHPPIPAKQSGATTLVDEQSEIETSSFQAVRSDDARDNTGPERISIPQEMQVAPAMDFESLGIEPVQHEVMSGAEVANAESAKIEEPAALVAEPEASAWQPAGFVIEAAPDSVDQQDEPFFATTDSQESTFELEPSVAVAATEQMPAESEVVAEGAAMVEPFEVEYTSAPAQEVEVTAAPELETNQPETSASLEAVTDPALLSAVEVATAFPTSFGTEVEAAPDEVAAEPEIEVAHTPESEPEESADDFEARVAAAMAAYEQASVVPVSGVDPPVNDEPGSAWIAEQVPLDASESAVSLEEEMALHQFPTTESGVPVEFAPVASAETVASEHGGDEHEAQVIVAEVPAEHDHFEAFEAETVTVAGTAEVVSQQVAPESFPEAEPQVEVTLVAAAAVGGLATAVAAAHPEHTPKATDEERIAQAIQRVLERLKPQLVSEIARELSKEED